MQIMENSATHTSFTGSFNPSNSVREAIGEKAIKELEELLAYKFFDLTIDTYEGGSIGQCKGLSYGVTDPRYARKPGKAMMLWDDLYPERENFKSPEEMVERIKTVVSKLISEGTISTLLTNFFSKK